MSIRTNFKKSFLGFILLLLLTAGWIYPKGVINSPAFKIYSSKNKVVKAIFESEFIPSPKFLKTSHSSSIVLLKNGDLLAFWFAGSREGQPDVKIWQSRYANGKWEMAHPIVSNYSLMSDLKRYISKLGNPVIYQTEDGRLHLFVVSVSIGGWGGASLNHLISNDEGKTWSRAKKLVLDPFTNISTLARSQPIPLQDGGFYLPVYQEFILKYPELLRFDKHGNFLQKIRISNHNTLLQPALVAIDESTAYAYMRNNGRINRILYRQVTHDGGLTWSNLQATNLNNYDASIAVAKLKPNLFLLVYNIKNRSKLALAISHDGLNWQTIKLLENYTDQGYAEFSYPSIIVHDEIVDISYTWYVPSIRHSIKHVRFNLAYLLGQTK